MSPTLDAFLRSWPWHPWLVAWLTIVAVIYVRGWLRLRHRDPPLPVARSLQDRDAQAGTSPARPSLSASRASQTPPEPALHPPQHLTSDRTTNRLRWSEWQLCAFLGGLGTIYLALGSPIETFATVLLQAHMVQHVLLMMVAAPLIWLGAPYFPILQGLPVSIRRYGVTPLVGSPALRGALARLTHPAVALPIYVIVTWGWHLPSAYQAALNWPALHYLQHACFLAAALIFWYPVVRPYPARPSWSLWLLLPFLLLADIQNTILSALLSFAPRPLYAFYESAPTMAGLTPLADQQAAGAIMWVPGSLAFSLPLFAIGLQLLFGRTNGERAETRLERQRTNPAEVRLPIVGAPRDRPAAPRGTRATARFDLLRVPMFGAWLSWRWTRSLLQAAVAVLAVVVIVDGLRGPQVGAMNLAGVVPWIHWRGLIIFGLLIAGNFFCMACPFTLARTLGRRWLTAGRVWPRRLRSKWLAVALVAAFLWAYEAFSLWDRPLWTAWITIGYFAAAFTIDGLFRGGTFCKYVCPIGQFQFVQSLVSPLEVQVRSPDACATCHGKECIRGGSGGPGCELQLFLPRKASNLDCTFCLDCVHACPHDNVGILATAPASSLWQDRFRSGVGRFARRPDLAALVVVLTFGAVANAAGMVGPVVDWQDWVGAKFGASSHVLSSSLFYLAALLLIPLATVYLAAQASGWCGGLRDAWCEVATRFAYALVPLGFSIWLTHYSFHFLTSFDSIVPTSQRFAQDFLGGWLGEPQWLLACCRPVGDGLLKLELLFLDVGLLGSLYVAWRIAGVATQAAGDRASSSSAVRIGAFWPWAVVLIGLFATAVWIVFQPMEMRGTLSG